MVGKQETAEPSVQHILDSCLDEESLRQEHSVDEILKMLMTSFLQEGDASASVITKVHQKLSDNILLQIRMASVAYHLLETW